MPLDAPNGTACFIDANIFYYHFVETPPLSQSCSDLLERVADGSVQAVTSAHLLAEMMHKVMVAEAASRFSLACASLVNWLQHHRERIAELDEFRQSVAEVRALPRTVLTPDVTTITLAADVAKKESLLTNDALTVALMRRDGVAHLATNDDDFDAVAGITVWKPR